MPNIAEGASEGFPLDAESRALVTAGVVQPPTVVAFGDLASPTGGGHPLGIANYVRPRRLVEPPGFAGYSASGGPENHPVSLLPAGGRPYARGGGKPVCGATVGGPAAKGGSGPERPVLASGCQSRPTSTNAALRSLPASEGESPYPATSRSATTMLGALRAFSMRLR